MGNSGKKRDGSPLIEENTKVLSPSPLIGWKVNLSRTLVYSVVMVPGKGVMGMIGHSVYPMPGMRPFHSGPALLPQS